MTHLKLITKDATVTGRAPSAITSAQRLADLRRVETTAKMARIAYFGPASQRAIFTAAMVLCCMAGGYILSEKTKWSDYFPPRYGWFITVATVVSYVVTYRTAPFKTWSDAIYARLAHYAPLDIEAYRDLQALAGKKRLDQLALAGWIDRERFAIRSSVGSSVRQKSGGKTAEEEFVDRSV